MPMHPILFTIDVPEWIGFLPDTITIYSYGFMIALGTVFAFLFTGWQAKKQYGASYKTTHDLILLLLISGIVGGKFFMFFEDPSYYARNMGALIASKGFVFYGALLFCIPAMIIFFNKNKLPTLGMLDIMGLTTGVVHGTGRIGCYLAGCCHGIEWHGPLAIVFTDPACSAPLNTPLHPTQLYAVFMIFSITIGLFIYSKNKRFDGQIFLLYIILYSIGRFVIEYFRGDESRGYVIGDAISNSQFIGLIFIGVAIYYYRKLSTKSKLSGK